LDYKIKTILEWVENGLGRIGQSLAIRAGDLHQLVILPCTTPNSLEFLPMKTDIKTGKTSWQSCVAVIYEIKNILHITFNDLFA